MKRFWAKVEKSSNCWLWQGSIATTGYGSFWYNGRQHGAHRIAYQLMREVIPKNYCIDHLCRIRRCVNPSHLEVVTNKVNVLRGVGLTAQNAQKDYCKRGHKFSKQNTYLVQNGRACRTCRAQAGLELRRAQKAGL